MSVTTSQYAPDDHGDSAMHCFDAQPKQALDLLFPPASLIIPLFASHFCATLSVEDSTGQK